MTTLEGLFSINIFLMVIIGQSKNLDYKNYLWINIAILVVIFIFDVFFNAFQAKKIYIPKNFDKEKIFSRQCYISLIAASSYSVIFWILRTVLAWKLSESGVMSVLLLIFLITFSIFCIFWFMVFILLIGDKVADSYKEFYEQESHQDKK